MDIEILEGSEFYDKNEADSWDGKDHEVDESTLEWVEKNRNLQILENFQQDVSPIYGSALELGAGHCWLSGEISKIKNVERVAAVDISLEQLRQRAPEVLDYLDADTDKINLFCGDFLDLSHFEENEFDFVVIDAALHHTYRPIQLLQEVRRVISPQGYVLIQREPIVFPLLSVSRWAGGSKWGFQRDPNEVRRLRQAGHSDQTELIFTFSELSTFAFLAGFDLIFYPYVPSGSTLEKPRRALTDLVRRVPWRTRWFFRRFHPSWYMVLQPSKGVRTKMWS